MPTFPKKKTVAFGAFALGTSLIVPTTRKSLTRSSCVALPTNPFGLFGKRAKRVSGQGPKQRATSVA